MPGHAFTSDEEDNIIGEIASEEQRVGSASAVSTYDLSDAITNFYNTYPSANPWVLIPLAKTYAAGMMDEKTSKDFLGQVTLRSVSAALQSYKPPKNKSWFQRNVSDKIKGGLRWAQGGVGYTIDVTQNVAGYAAGEFLSALDSMDVIQRTVTTGQLPGTIPSGQAPVLDLDLTLAPENVTRGSGNVKDMFWDATILGQMVQHPELLGTSRLINPRIYELQGEEARKVRGTINGHAITVGRATADLLVQPGTLEYNILSGLIDIGVSLEVPAVPGGKQISQALKVTTESLLPVRAMAGLHAAESALILPQKVSEYLRSSGGKSVIERLVKVNTVDEAMELFPTATPKFWTEIVDAKDVQAVQSLLQDTLGLEDITRGVGPKSVDDINISRWDDVKRNIPYFGTQKESKVARIMADMPGNHVIISGGSDREVAKSIKNVKNYLRSIKLPVDQRTDLVEELTRAFVEGDNSMRNVVDKIEKISRQSFKHMGVSDELNDALHIGFGDFKEIYENSLYGSIGDIGTSADHGGVFNFAVNGQIIPVPQPLNTAVIQSEALKHSIFLADPRQVRRIAAKYSPLTWVTSRQGIKNLFGLKTTTKLGKLRLPFSAIEFMQNDIWRPVTLATGGYVFRNMSDSLLRQSFAPNIATGIFHPFELIQVAMFKKLKGDIWGGSFEGNAEDLIRNGQLEMAEASAAKIRETLNPISRLAREQKTGVWERVEIGNGIKAYGEGVASEVALLHYDEAAKLIAAGKRPDEVVDWMLYTDEGKKYVKQLQNLWSNRVIIDPTTQQKVVGSAVFIRADGSVDAQQLLEYVRTVTVGRVAKVTGDEPGLLHAIATGKFIDSAGDEILAWTAHPNGQIKDFQKEFYAHINNVIKDPNITLKEWYKKQITVRVRGTSSTRDEIFGAYDKAVDIFFGQLYGKREGFLNRSPVFRQQYYYVVNQFLDALAPGEAKIILNKIEKAAVDAGEKFDDKFLARYVGDKDLAQKLLDKGTGGALSNGKLTAEQLDAYAKGYALDETKKLFYNAAEKSNFADILRVIVPFGSAWAEVSKNWGKMLATDPEVLKNASRSVQGLMNADPDNDGRGFFYKSPTSGDYVFNFPLSQHFAPWMTTVGGAGLGFIVAGLPGAAAGASIGGGFGAGAESQLSVKADMTAPAKSLNMGLELQPGFSPVVQWAADKIIGNKPKYDDIRKMIMPYGSPDSAFGILPPWADKALQAWTADPETDRLFGDLVLQSMEAMAATGDYDLTTRVGGKKLEDDAMVQARILLGLRAFGQLVGPARPVPNIYAPIPEDKQHGIITVGKEKLDLSKVDLHGAELAKIFRQFQTENYDTAVSRFMDTFGPDAILYMAGKTKTQYGGMDASKEFGAWERNNSKFVDTYREVAGYFADVGTEFDYQVYARQISEGSRKLLVGTELISESQRLVGTALYRELVRAAGPKPNAAQKDYLAIERAKLEKEYPGFRDAAINVNQTPTQINILYEAAFDSRMDNNNVAIATRQYLTVRDKALEVAAQRGKGLGTSANADLCDILRAEGERLTTVYPEFARLWDRLLFQEVDINVKKGS